MTSTKNAFLFVGAPETGKTEMITCLTKSTIKEGNYDFTTRMVTVAELEGEVYCELGGTLCADVIAGISTFDDELKLMKKHKVLVGKTIEVVVLVYDQDKPKSFTAMSNMYNAITRAKCSEHWKFVVVANCTESKWDDSRSYEPLLKDRLKQFLDRDNVVGHFSLCSQKLRSMEAFIQYIHSCYYGVDYTPGNIVPEGMVLYVGASKTGKTQAKVLMLTSKDRDLFGEYTPDFFPLKVADHSQQIISNCRKALWHLEVGGSAFENPRHKPIHKMLFRQANLVVFLFDEERSDTLEAAHKIFQEYMPRKFILVNNGMTSPEQRTSQCDVEMLNQLRDAASFYTKLSTPKTDDNIEQLFEKIHELCELEISVSTTNITTMTTITTTTTTIITELDMYNRENRLSDLQDKVKDDSELIVQLTSKLEKLKTDHHMLQIKCDDQKRIMASISD